ncbi:MAG: hypothetical protein MK538_11335, partial [Planctomycetes bacterium]|nr:hypothetical protein [Planctomycetota bacterium]
RCTRSRRTTVELLNFSHVKMPRINIQNWPSLVEITEIKEILVYRAPNADLMDVCCAPWATGP